MTNPLTPEQVAEIKAETESYVAANYPNRQNQTILSLIATIEEQQAAVQEAYDFVKRTEVIHKTRDAAFDAMLAALKPFARQLNQEKYISHPQWPDNQSFIGFDFKLGDLRAASAAIAQAEKVKCDGL